MYMSKTPLYSTSTVLTRMKRIKRFKPRWLFTSVTMFSEKKDTRKGLSGLSGECLTKSALSFDDSTKRKSLPFDVNLSSFSEHASQDFDDFDFDGFDCGAGIFPNLKDELDSSREKPLVDFDAPNIKAHGLLVSNSEENNTREASTRRCMTNSVCSLVDSMPSISSMDFDALDNRSHLGRAFQSGPIVFNLEQKDTREGLSGQWLTKSAPSFDDKQKLLSDVRILASLELTSQKVYDIGDFDGFDHCAGSLPNLEDEVLQTSHSSVGHLSTKLRLVRCPKCRRVLPEPANIPVYMCGGCNTVLQAKHIHISLLGRFAPRPSTLLGGREIVGPIALSSSEFASTNNKAQRVGQDKSGSAASNSKKKRTREQEDCKEINTSITLDDLRQHYGSKRKDVAESLGVSVSTLKRTCRQYGIKRWPNIIRKKAGRLPDQHGEENPSLTCETLSTKGQTAMENEIVEGPNEAGVSSECEFQLINQWSQFSPHPNSYGPVVPHPHITSTQILGENMGSLGYWRNLFASLEEPLLQVHVSGSMWTVPPCLDEAPSRLMPTTAHTTESSDDLRNLLPWVEEPFSAGHVSGSIDWTVPPCSVPAPSQPMPTIANTTGSLDDLRNLLPWVEEPFSAGHVSGSIDWTVPPCSVPAPSQPMPAIANTTGSSDDLRNLLPLVEEPFSVGCVSGSIDWTVPPCFVPALSQPMPTIAHTTGSSDDLGNLLALMEEPFSAGQVSRSVSGTGPSFSDPALSQLMPTIPHTMPTVPRMMPLLTERQDTRSVKLRATYGDTTIKFNLPLTSGISELNKEVLKRLEFELGRFRVEYEDEDGVLILIACDEDIRDYLQFLTSSGNQVFKPLVLKKVPNTTNVCETCESLKRERQ